MQLKMLTMLCKSAGESPAEHYEAGADHGCECYEEDEVVDEDYFADCLEAGELVGLGVEEGCNAAGGHSTGEPCEGEAGGLG
jgi:hypothetical protein